MVTYRRVILPAALGGSTASAAIAYATSDKHPIWVLILAAALAFATLFETVRAIR